MRSLSGAKVLYLEYQGDIEYPNLFDDRRTAEVFRMQLRLFRLELEIGLAKERAK